MTYGETVITLRLRARALGARFELLHADLLLGDLFQVVLTLWRALRARHPPACARRCSPTRAITARYRGERARVPLAPRRRGADAAPRARQRRLPRRRRSTALKARLQARGVPVLPRIAHRLAMAVAQVSIGDPSSSTRAST